MIPGGQIGNDPEMALELETPLGAKKNDENDD